MFENTKLLYLYTETPLHVGSGSSVSWVDKPIQRESHTGHPVVQATGVKGALRDWAERKETDGTPKFDKKKVDVVFGPETDSEKFGGSLATTDARILFFPVRSFKGVFAWITCPLVLKRLARELMRAGEPELEKTVKELSTDILEDTAIVNKDCCPLLAGDNKLILEDYGFTAKPEEAVGKLAEYLQSYLPEIMRDRLTGSLVVVSDDTFNHFVEFSTEVVTRIKIDNESGTAAGGGLWAQELLPTDTLLYSMVLATKPKKSGMGIETADGILGFLIGEVLNAKILQLGGDETVGRGLVRVSWKGQDTETAGTKEEEK